MHPMRLITYAVLTSVASLVAMGGVGFYVGYSAGRGDLSELKALVATGGSPENAAALAELLKQNSNQAVAQAPAPEVNLGPVLDEIRSMSAQLGKLEKNAAATPAPATPQVVDRVVEKVKEDPKTKQELTSVKQLLAEANEQYQTCKASLTTLEAKLDDAKASPTQVSLNQSDTRDNVPAARENASVVLFDNVLLKRDQNKLYNDVDVALSLQSIASRSARVVVNQQSLGISFGERKIFQHRDVTCELVLMETDLEGGKARFSIACKR
ncbi:MULTISPECIES: hypothetical protein [Rhodomicrobium]|uniref:hypothetical protein n=1 Tax=Rhodomicrobium TaxID=1068 RepID=UPI000B4A64BF|nr:MULTISPECIES: hypothetical protein [Rhodomicrobium]